MSWLFYSLPLSLRVHHYIFFLQHRQADTFWLHLRFLRVSVRKKNGVFIPRLTSTLCQQSTHQPTPSLIGPFFPSLFLQLCCPSFVPSFHQSIIIPFSIHHIPPSMSFDTIKERTNNLSHHLSSTNRPTTIIHAHCYSYCMQIHICHSLRTQTHFPHPIHSLFSLSFSCTAHLLL